jgi:predicted transcriptional regulator of viral defense system
LSENDEVMEHHSASQQSSTQGHAVIELARRKGLLRSSDLQQAGIPRVVLTRLSASGALERVGRGLYRLPDAMLSEHESLVTVATRVPQAVFCLLTALQFHGLTTQLPRQVWIAMPRGSHVPRINYPPLRMVQFGELAYADGVEMHVRDQATLRVYSVAKTVADCFKMRGRIGLDVALEALREAHSSGKASADELWRHAKVCRVTNVMRPYLETIA